MQGEIEWLELPGGTCPRTGRFYAEALGWLVDDSGDTVWFREPSGRLGGAFRGDLPPSATATGPILYLAVDDATATLARIRDAGGEVVLDRTEIAPGVGHRALFRDPAGSTMGLFERSG
jgi:predicted enzyme related to lactoylglutathione lyase